MEDGTGSPPDTSSDTQPSVTGKFTLLIDCEGLLKASATQADTFTSKTGVEAARFLQLDTLLAVPILHCIKIKCNHTCGRVRVEEDACMTTFFSLGDWFIEEYRVRGKSAQCEATRNPGGDLSEPDATLTVFI